MGRDRRNRLARSCAVVLTAAAAVLSSAQPVAAAGIVELSDDGVTYGTALGEPLFSGLGRMVPKDARSTVFYVRNSGPEPGLLRITLSDVVVSDDDYPDSVTVTAQSPSTIGTPIPVRKARPCWVLIEGDVVAPGGVVPVTATLAVGNLEGRSGQGSTATMNIRVSLSSTAAGGLPPTSCGVDGADVAFVGASAGDRATPARKGAGPPPLWRGGLDPNTWRLYEEYHVLALLVAALIGSAWFIVIARRRGRDGTEDDTDATT